MLDQRFTIQAYLKAVGYRTGIFGKYFNAWNVFRSPPWFDDWAIFSAGYSPFRVNERGTIKTITQYATSYIRDNAVSFIEASENQDATPWFLEVTTTAPHAPFTPDTLYENASVSPYSPESRGLGDRQARQAATHRRPGRSRSRPWRTSARISCAR